MVSKEFIKLWEPRYDVKKYPVSFYLSHLDKIQKTDTPETLKISLIALLHWKDGKAAEYEFGKISAKPNILNPILIQTGSSMNSFFQFFMNLRRSKESELFSFARLFREKLNDMWKTVVIPAFVLHVARPDRLPIIDQHTIRAFLCLTIGNIVEKPKITWDIWEAYLSFFSGYGFSFWS